MIETWSALEVIGGIVITVVICSPPVYAWADRWLDRTRNKVTDKVESEDKKNE